MPLRSRLTSPPLALAAILPISVALLHLQGRRLWCALGDPAIWISDVWTPHCSQHPFDPYSFTHFSHGLIFFALLFPFASRLGWSWRLSIAILIAAAWEIVENSSLVIERYRTATMSLDYLGDSITNALGDILSCALGFLVAGRLTWRLALSLFALLESALLFAIRDNLTLNVIMLLYPLDFIKSWQSFGHAMP